MPPLPRILPWQLAITAISLAFFMVILDSTVVNVALERIREDLHTDTSGLQWIVDGYALVFASLLMAGGALGDRLGNRRVFLGGLFFFVIASILCGLAQNLGVLIIARLFQGAGAALIVPTSLSVLRYTFSDPARRARAVSAWAATGACALASGPLLGGVIIGAIGWRAIFWINAPLGAIATLMAWHSIPAEKRHVYAGMNFPAQAAGVVALATFTFVIIEGPNRGWTSKPILSCLVVALAALAGFIYLERTHQSPIVPRYLWTHGPFAIATAVGLIANYSYYGIIFVLSLFYEHHMSLSALQTGVRFLPLTGIVFFANVSVGRINAKLGPKMPIAAGLTLVFIGETLLPWAASVHGELSIAVVLLLIGFGSGLIMPSITSLTLESVPREITGMASGILNTSRQIGGVIGVAVFGAILSASSQNFDAAFKAIAITGGALTLIALGATLRFVKRQAPSNTTELVVESSH